MSKKVYLQYFGNSGNVFFHLISNCFSLDVRTKYVFAYGRPICPPETSNSIKSSISATIECKPTDLFKKVSGMDSWCSSSCNQNPLPEWAEEDCQFLLKKETYSPNLQQIIKKTKGISKISTKHKNLAINLILWRESAAQKKNKPRKWIMSDEKLIDYATGNINLTSNKLNEFENFIKQNKQDFKNLNLVKISKPLSEDELIRKTELKEQIRLLSIEHGLPPELICTSKNLINFIRGIDSSSLNSGWRSKIFKI